MKRYVGGTKVQGGYYFHVEKWEIHTVREDVGALPGTAKDTWIHAPLPVLMMLAPVMGGVFAVFLPFLGFVMPVYALGKKLIGASTHAMNEVAATVAPTWQPGEAYLADKAEEKKAPEAAATEASKKIEELGKEIQERRAEEKK